MHFIKCGVSVCATLLLFSLELYPHPGPGIVKDSKGNIYYTDLAQVWKLSPNGYKTIVVSGVHTHELFIDPHDVLFGEHVWYNGEQAITWGCYAWRLRPNGKLDTIFGPAAAFQNDYSLNRDARGNQFYVQQQPIKKFFRINPDGSLKKIAEGNFKNISYMMITPDGNWYFTSENNLFLVDTAGRITTLAKEIGSSSISHPADFKDPTTLGIWGDQLNNIYVADYSGQKVKRVNPMGKVEVIAYSQSPWSPVGGLIDDQGNLWLLENDNANRVRLRKLDHKALNTKGEFKPSIWSNGLTQCILTASIAAMVAAFYFIISSRRNTATIRI